MNGVLRVVEMCWSLPVWRELVMQTCWSESRLSEWQGQDWQRILEFPSPLSFPQPPRTGVMSALGRAHGSIPLEPGADLFFNSTTL